MSETTKVPITGIKVRMVPATRPGRERGSVTRKKVRKGRAPRSAAASKSDGSIFSSDVKMGRIMKGRNS